MSGNRRSKLPPQKNKTKLGHQVECPVLGSGAGAEGASAAVDGSSLPPPPDPGLLVGAGPGGTVGGMAVGGTDVGGIGVGTGEVGAGVKPAWTD
jgi:hypothetical protein